MKTMKKHYLDNIRWMTVVLVVLYHTVYMYNGIGIPGVAGKITDAEVQYIDLFQYIVYPWFMALLFIVSGICARFALQKYTEKDFLRKRTVKLLVPSTIGLFVFQFIQGYINMELSGMAFESIKDVPGLVKFVIMCVSGTGALWYIQMLWVFSVLLVFIRRFEKDRLWKMGGKTGIPALVLTAVPVYLAAQVLNTPVIVVYRFGLYGFVFFFGYFVLSHEEVIAKLRKWSLPLAAAAAALCAAFCIRYFGQVYADVPVNRSVLFTGFCWSGCLAVLGIMAEYGDFENGLTRWMGKRSFGLYIFHYLGISAFALYIGRKGLMPAPAVYFLTMVSGFAAGYILNAVISAIPFLRWAVLGIEKEKRDRHV